MDPAHQYLIAIDRDPDEAAKIAIDTARSMFLKPSLMDVIVNVTSALELETKELKLLDLTKSLGEFLTDEDRTIRAKGGITFLHIVYT